jgi:hypothetical protein
VIKVSAATPSLRILLNVTTHRVCDFRGMAFQHRGLGAPTPVSSLFSTRQLPFELALSLPKIGSLVPLKTTTVRCTRISKETRTISSFQPPPAELQDQLERLEAGSGFAVTAVLPLTSNRLGPTGHNTLHGRLGCSVSTQTHGQRPKRPLIGPGNETSQTLTDSDLYLDPLTAQVERDVTCRVCVGSEEAPLGLEHI